MEDQRKVEKALNQVIIDLDKSHLRRMQVHLTFKFIGCVMHEIKYF